MTTDARGSGELRGAPRDARPSQRLTYVVGSILIGVGLLHLAGYALLGGPWVGPVAWRKPFAFGVSFGLTTMTLGWLSGYLALRPRAQWVLLVPLVVANSIEVAWVSVQRARGVASHSTSTPRSTRRCSSPTASRSR